MGAPMPNVVTRRVLFARRYHKGTIAMVSDRVTFDRRRPPFACHHKTTWHVVWVFPWRVKHHWG